MIQRYETGGKLDLDSRSVREISYNLVLCNFRIDPICDQFVDYILENWDHVTGETVEKVRGRVLLKQNESKSKFHF